MSRFTRPAALTLVALLVGAPFDTRVAAQTSPCFRFEQQLKQDQNAMRRQQDSIGKNLKELEEFDKQAKEAALNAAKTTATAAFGRIAKMLEGRQAALRGLRDQMDRAITRNLPRTMGNNGSQLAVNARRQIQDAIDAYDRAKAQVNVGKLLETGLSADSLFSLVNATISTVGAAQAQTDATVRAAINSEELSGWFSASNPLLPGMEVTKTLVETAIGMTPFGVFADVTSFLIDSGYNALDMAKAREGILRSANLSERDLEAVNALKKQIERTVANLQECRADVQAKQEQQKQEQQQQQQEQQKPQQQQPKPTNTGTQAASNVGKVVGTTVGVAGAAVGGIYLASELEKLAEPVLDCSAQESAAERAVNSLFNTVNTYVTCEASARTASACNSQFNAVNNSIQGVLNAAGNICSCYGASAATELSASDKAAVNDALRQLRSFGFNTGTLPSCFR